MTKYLVTARFEWNEEAMQAVPGHRKYINALINEQVIDHYVVSMETRTAWITMNALNKTGVRRILLKSPFYKYWKLEIHELVIWDGQNYRLPVMQLN